MRTELDSHADTCVAGRNTLLLSDEGRQVTVHPYSGEYKPIQDVSIATVATMWIHPQNGQPYILIIHEALYFGDRVDVTLLNPNQLRANGVIVEDVPRQFDSKSSHSIYLPTAKLRIPLSLDGISSGFVGFCGAIGPEDGSLADRLVAAVNVAADDTAGDGLSGRNDNDVYPMDDESRKLFALSTSDKRSVITPEILSRRWGVGLDTAKRTLKVTTQSGIRNVLAKGERKVRQKLDHLAFPNLSGKWYSDTMFSKTQSIRGHLTAQVFTNGRGSDHFYPMKSKSMAGPNALMPFIQEVGIPQTIVTDNAPEEVHGEFGKICRQFRIRQEQTVPYSPWSNLAESTIRELKVGIRRTLRRSKAPRRLWCFCGKWVAAIRRLTALDMPQLQGRVPDEDVLGSTPDISQYAQFDWYEPVLYWDPVGTFPHEQKLLGRWLGIAEVSTDLIKTGKIIVRKSVWGLSEDDFANPDVKTRLVELNEGIRSKIGDDLKDEDIDPELRGSMPEISDDVFVTIQGTRQGGEAKKATVIGRKRDHDGRPIGKRHANPLLDTRLYEVEFPDGSTEAIAANLIAENMLSQVDDEGRSYSVLSEIVDHRTNGHAISKDDGFVEDRYGKRHPRITTRGWDLQVEWRDGSTTWVPLSELKESNPVEVAEYAVANKIAEEPAFAWWVRKALRKRDRIIKKVKARYWAKTHKFGIELPKTVAEALKIDERTGTDFWRKAIEQEMKNVMPAFEFIDGDEAPKFYKKIDCHMIFDVKMDLTRKARLVAGGHQTDPPKESTYSSVVSRDSIRIAFTLAALNDLDVLSADVQGAYLNAPTKEKVYTIAGLEFGADKVGRPVLIVRALYGLKSSGARWRDHMASTLREGGFVSCKGDPDVDET
ncbi:Reverse transcriptase (RNA-dependent DNA polymerase) [Fragilaria crotonensis]|nr:Reverse transcriptase (RNA-dependent DNA polymerase) [Fragilaria crotonensis]